jgi:lipopolysaccharide assembly protein A
MSFLKTIFWVLVAVVAALFSFANWKTVDIRLWGDLVWSPPLPFPIICAFLLGLVPMLIVHRATRWSLRRRLDNANRALTDALPTPTSMQGTTFAAQDMAPPGASPIAPPPGVA